MKVLPGPTAPPAATTAVAADAAAAHARRHAWLVGVGFALFALCAFAAALVV